MEGGFWVRIGGREKRAVSSAEFATSKACQPAIPRRYPNCKCNDALRPPAVRMARLPLPSVAQYTPPNLKKAIMAVHIPFLATFTWYDLMSLMELGF